MKAQQLSISSSSPSDFAAGHRQPAAPHDPRQIELEKEFFGTGVVLSLAEKRGFLARVVRCRCPELPENSDLLAGIQTDGKSDQRKVFDKLKAIRLDNLLAGHGAVTQR